MNKKMVVTLTAFVFSIFIAYLGGIYKNVNDKERFFFNIELPSNQKKVYHIDLAERGWLKNALQPDTISVYARCKVNGQYESIKADFQGLDCYLSQRSKKSRWPELKNDDSIKFRENGWTPVNIEIKVPKDQIKQYRVASARLLFKDGAKEIGQVEFIIINSRFNDNKA